MKNIKFLFLAIMASLLFSCGDEFENEYEKENEEIVFNADAEVKVSLKETRYRWFYTFSSDLKEKLPDKKIEFGVLWGGDSDGDGISDLSTMLVDGESEVVVYPIKSVDYYASFYFSLKTYDSIEKKIASGEKLTESESRLYKDVINTLEEALYKYFEAEPFVKVDGVLYILKVDRFY